MLVKCAAERHPDEAMAGPLFAAPDSSANGYKLRRSPRIWTNRRMIVCLLALSFRAIEVTKRPVA